MTNTRSMKIERAKLSYEPNTTYIVDLRMAANMLNAKSYGRYKLCLKRVSEYECTKV